LREKGSSFQVEWLSTELMQPSTSTSHSWTAPDGETFSYSRWGGEAGAGGGARAVVAAVHGLSGAALDYEPLGAHLAKLGVVTVAPELRGQGNDPRPERRGDLAGLEVWLGDLRAFFALTRKLNPGAAIYYYGESMGAALLTHFVAGAGEADQPAGLVLASPVVIVPGNPGWWQHQVLNFFLLVNPTHRVDVSKYTKRWDKNDPSKWVTRDASHRLWFETAPHKIERFTMRFFKCVHDLMEGCFDDAPRVRAPVLVLYAANDVYIPPAKVEEFFGRLGSGEKELEFFRESYHLLLHDHDKMEALERIERWLAGRMGQK
jgi:alpha-beta hydrolase superfamily lysophospholipase